MLSHPRAMWAALIAVILTLGACTSPPSDAERPYRNNTPQEGIALCPSIINTDRPPRFLGDRADVSDLDISEDYYRIPEIRSENGKLEVDMHVYYQRYQVGPDTVFLRTYDAEQGDDVMVPLGPTLRVKRSDRLTVQMHNDLPLNQNWNYLFMLEDLDAIENLLNDDPSQDLIDLMHIENDKEKKRRGGSATGMINLTDPYGMTIRKDSLDPEGEWRITANDSAMIVKRKWNHAQGKTMLFVYLEFFPDNTNIAQDFNTTNLHFHGGHVSPFQDDVLRYVTPTYSSYYTYDLDNHQAGTFWYHPHVHGSSALQVATGMGGILIVEEDNLDKYPALAAASEEEHERIMVFDQLQYDTINGELTDFEMLGVLGGFAGLQKSGARGTLVNGRIKPNFTMKAGEVQRWRLLHKGFHTELGLRFPEEFEVYQIAVDGVMFDEPRQIWSLHLAPGNRSDVLVKVPDNVQGAFEVMSTPYVPECEYFTEEIACKTPSDDDEAMLFIKVEGAMEKPMALPQNGLPPRAAELQNDIAATDVDYHRDCVFDINSDGFVVNGAPFNGNRIDCKPLVGSNEEWRVSSQTGSHPMHIHINHFQVVEFAGREVKPAIWKDGVWVDPADEEAGNPDRYAIVRMHYHKYWGDFVMHCHVLDHEDQGMMQRVTVVRDPKEADLSRDVPPGGTAAVP